VTEMNFLELTFTLDTNAYASGDVIADTQALVNVTRLQGGRAKLVSVALIDEDDQKVALNLIFFRTNVSLGTENSGGSITDADGRECLGHVAIAAADYKDLGGVAVACLKNIQLVLQAGAGSRDIYVAILNETGTPTYTASGLKLRVGVELD
jgi:hypothetical protein